MIDTSKRTAALRKMIKTKQRALENAPEGRLRISNNNGYIKYYIVLPDEKSSGRYIARSDIALAEKLAQKDYDERVLKAAEQELKAWLLLADRFPSHPVEEVFDLLSPLRQTLVSPIRQSDEEYRKQWEAVTYEPGWFKTGDPVYITDRGERVRSKSEQLIANLLNRLGIPYRYEYPLELNVDGVTRTWRPDFMVLDVKRRREFFIEHFGRLDDANYARNAFDKMRIYEENGLYEGHGIYYFFEADGAPPDMRYIEAKLRRIVRVGDSRPSTCSFC